MNITKKKQTHRYKEQTGGYTRDRKEGRGKKGVGDYKVQTTIYNVNKLQEYII